MKKRTPQRPRHGKANALVIVLIVVGGGFFFLFVCGGVLVALLLPAIAAARHTAQQAVVSNNMKQIGLALHMYHEVYHSLPPVYVADENGKPMHSWRVLILPFLERQDLYESYDFDEPWDGPTNSMMMAARPEVYADPRVSDDDGTKTTFQAIAGPGALFDPTVPKVSFADVTDGISNSAAVVENCADPVVWTKPDDTSPEEFVNGFTVGNAPMQEIVVLRGDGSISVVPKEQLPTLKGWTTRAGND
ncbi:DUF1559 domain-containing protein [Blastopirellula sp. JC732]|uniref:DUF1559 domain-containing protein n=1 Tax=Blastopirellula sediminis TaxID=2894196 RepID=A0A9X1SJM4_9BACT|nr:DUF1559 domain-containing protein [Blastopirellula sediminis]MCC9609735.1 DUF1559 domain-containing protein [Blastopirellula sediminis]MCC9628979.1 DUF1559 domain-containing protein [Blastopirellula sediminis]